MCEVFSGWDGSTAQARALQLELAQRVMLKDGFAKRLRTVAGFDVGFEEGGATTRAAAVLLDAVTLQPIAAQVARVNDDAVCTRAAQLPRTASAAGCTGTVAA